MKLVIVESPTKAKTIGRFLGSGFTIRASMGHVMDLPKSKLGVDVEHNFTPDYQLSADKKKTVAELRKLAKEADEIILATDPDREGEAISAHIKELLSGESVGHSNSKSAKHSAHSSKPFVRMVFHEITKEAIQEALGHPGEVNVQLVDAQTARRVLDRLVGYKISPVLWQKVRRGLSAGRVQSVALRLIVEREKEIEKFIKENYWTISVLLSREGSSRLSSMKHDVQRSLEDTSTAVPTSLNESRLPKEDGKTIKGKQSTSNSVSEGQPSASLHTDAVSFDLIEIKGEKIEKQQSYQLYDGKYTVTKTNIVSEESSKGIEKDLQTKVFVVRDVLEKRTKRSPLPPFTTSTLQQDASRRLGYSGKRTMSLAQKLYEEGFITYHRTDSVNLASSAVMGVRAFIEKAYGAKYLPDKPRFFNSKQKLAQEAHEAVRPTQVGMSSEKVAGDLGRDYAKLYDLIWRRFVACQMSEALTESTTVIVDAHRGPVASPELVQQASSVPSAPQNSLPSLRSVQKSFGGPPSRTTPSDYTFKTTGSVLVFDGYLKVTPYNLQDKNLPKFTALERLDLQDVLTEKHETPPPPRYNDASLIGSLEEEGIGRPSTYASIISTIIDRQYVEKDQGKFTPTSIGIAVTDFLVKNFPDIDDIPFTAKIEDELDAIANEGKPWVPMMQDFYTPFEKQLEKVKKADRVEIPTEETGEKCPKDGAPLVVRVGKFGKFISCKNFPTCDFKKPYVEETNFTCPKDGGKIIARKTRKGRTFYGCANYPKCDYAAWKLQDVKRDLEQGIQERPAAKKTAKKS